VPRDDVDAASMEALPDPMPGRDSVRADGLDDRILVQTDLSGSA
jgi:hypothetical protein